jgi:hypothetical protein
MARLSSIGLGIPSSTTVCSAHLRPIRLLRMADELFLPPLTALDYLGASYYSAPEEGFGPKTVRLLIFTSPARESRT